MCPTIYDPIRIKIARTKNAIPSPTVILVSINSAPLSY